MQHVEGRHIVAQFPLSRFFQNHSRKSALKGKIFSSANRTSKSCQRALHRLSTLFQCQNLRGQHGDWELGCMELPLVPRFRKVNDCCSVMLTMNICLFTKLFQPWKHWQEWIKFCWLLVACCTSFSCIKPTKRIG